MPGTSLPQYSPLVTFLILLSVMVLRYFTVAGGFILFLKKAKRQPIDETAATPSQMKKDVLWSILSSVIFAASGTLMIKLWQEGRTKIYLDVQEYGLWYLVASLVLYLLIHDTYFYWTHRLLHLRVFFKTFHKVHHESKTPTAWTSFSFHPYEALIQAIILPLLVVTIPIHWVALLLFLSIMTILGVLNHLGHELYPAILEKRLYLISATHHQFHHRRVNKNFGLYFTIWDRLLDTEGRHE